ncbi:hypothetical protein [Bradyrhizobium sp. AUGA SZCCT0283]|uniref:hypothetical protein n=1 Tax=Bradyrhizobium sp. AUGA SZCCT0283 TaxID=2807671 RepID=UPI001BA74B58|nr:hypothetical protein [Bradyrhizobium sp. AUGA SZCCT0283]MBR1277694.1 hypothetical protein [Bradyrhizobium sp. AUGA SZCCT0283]
MMGTLRFAHPSTSGEGFGNWATYQLRKLFRNCRRHCTRKRRAEAGYRFYAALDVVEAKGIASKSCDGVDVLIHHAEQVSIEWTLATHERPNGLNVWRHGNFRSFRVLDVIWSDGTMPLILAYRGGGWERLLRQELSPTR